MKQERLYWINCAKAICMICVYLQHTITLYGISPLGYNPYYVASFYVNAFFFVSGYLYFWKVACVKTDNASAIVVTGRGKIAFHNALFKIAIPSVIFALFEFIPKKLIHRSQFDFWDFIYETIGGGTYWFTSALFIAEMTLLILMITKMRNVWFYLIVCLIFAYIGSDSQITQHLTINEKYLWYWPSGLISLFFMALGGVYYKYEEIMVIFNKWYYILYVVVIWILIIHFWGPNLKFSPLIRLLNIEGAIVGGLASFMVVLFSKKMVYLKLFDIIGENSLVFYFLSGAVPTVLCLAFNKFTSPSLYCLLFVFILSLIVSLFITKAIKKHIPYILDIRLLWR